MSKITAISQEILKNLATPAGSHKENNTLVTKDVLFLHIGATNYKITMNVKFTYSLEKSTNSLKRRFIGISIVTLINILSF